MSINGVRNNFNWIYGSQTTVVQNVSEDGTARKIIGNQKLNQSNDTNGIQLLTEEDLEKFKIPENLKEGEILSDLNEGIQNEGSWNTQKMGFKG